MKQIFSLLLAFVAFSAFSQDFEGKIVYVNSFYSKTPGVNDLQWAQMFGNREEYFYKSGNYVIKTNGTLVSSQQYISAENRIYSKVSNSEKLLWSDAGLNTDSVLNVELCKNVATILNYPCDELIITTTSGVHYYWFNSRFQVDPKLFLKHRSGNWAYYLKKAKALPLKMIVETPKFTIESQAIEVRYMKIDDTFFELPNGVKTEKSPM